jgi:hypothetical protein
MFKFHQLNTPRELTLLDLGPLDQHHYTELQRTEEATDVLIVLPRDGKTEPMVVTDYDASVVLSPISGRGVVLVGTKDNGRTHVRPWLFDVTQQSSRQGLRLQRGAPFAIVNLDAESDLVVFRGLSEDAPVGTLQPSRNLAIARRLATYASRPLIGETFPTE